MAVRGRIALLLGQPEEFYQKRFINGFLEKMFAAGYDVCMFAMYVKYQNSTPRETGESNIYSLVNYDLFDAVVILPDTIQTPGVWKNIEERIHERFQGPVLVVDLDSRYFESIWTDSYTPVQKLIGHLIEEHGYTDIAFLTGRKKHPHSQKRLQAYRDAMEAHGLPVREDRIFYGDFWYSSGNACAEVLMKQREDMPRAIACANDCMAIGVAEALEKNGIRIPEDVAVIGFDSIPEGQTSPRPVTSAYIPARSTGKHAAESILRLMAKEPIRDPETEVDLFIGSSCGCVYHKGIADSGLRKKWGTDLSEANFFSLHNHLAEDILIQNKLQDVLGVIYSNLYQIRGYESFHLCLNDQWLTPAELTGGRILSHGYGERMLEAVVSRRDDELPDKVGSPESFATEQLLPELHQEHQTPVAYMFSPLHFEADCFGYAVISYGSRPESYNDTYRLWLHSVNCGLESIRRQMVSAIRRDATGGNASQPITERDREGMAEVTRILDENRFTYFFQPIVSATDGSIYAFEALMRAQSEKKISPLQIIKYAGMLRRLGDVEKATFLNVLNRIEQKEDLIDGRRIFINSIPGIRLEPEVRSEIERMLSKRGSQAVIELTEQSELDDNELEDMKDNYAKLGIGTAVDDYGTGYSNISNLLRYMPDYVKVDRSLLSGIQDSPQKQHFVREIIAFSHDNGIRVLAEGVETSEELRTVIWLGCDLIQGYYTGRPGPEILSAIDPKRIEEIRNFQKDREKGPMQRVYETGKTSRYSAGTLEREGYTTICSKGCDQTYRDYVLSGTPGQWSEMMLEFRDGYEGKVTLERLHLRAHKGLPCIRIGAGCNVTIELVGDNELEAGGVEVSEDAKLTMQGDGDLTIRLKGNDYCGIGNAKGTAGILEFYQDGAINIEANGMHGAAIGGESGADIRIHSGRYAITQHGDQGVGIGCLEGDIRLVIRNCEMDLTQSYANGCAIGSFGGNAFVDIQKTYIHCIGSGSDSVVLGSVQGRATVKLENMASEFDIRAQKGCGLGSLYGTTEVELFKMSYRFTGSGQEVFAFASVNGEGQVRVSNSDLCLRVNNELWKVTMLTEKDYSVKDSRYDVILNGCAPGEDERVSGLCCQ